MNCFIICNKLSKKYGKFFHNPYLIVAFEKSSYSQDLTFLCVANLRCNNSHKMIARSCCDEPLPNYMEQTL